jgi:hypothetical protein
MHAAYTWAIADALEAAGVETPVPQTDLRVRSLFGREGEAALSTLGLGGGPSAPASPPPDRSGAVNDAADDVMAPPRADEGEGDDERRS